MDTRAQMAEEAQIAIVGQLKPAYLCSLLIAVLMGASSMASLLFQETVYATEELVEGFVPNDVVNVTIGLPVMLGALWLARRGKLIGLLLWPGALFYVLYNYLVYLFAMPLNELFPAYLLLVTLSAYTIMGVIASIDGRTVERALASRVPVRLAGGFLAAIGTLFALRAIGLLAGALINESPVAKVEQALLVTDFLAGPAWVIGGVLLWQRRRLGYVVSVGLLYQASMLFAGLVIVLILQPFLTGLPFARADTLIVAVLGIVCSIPFALFVRGVVTNQ
jgi:hypothetical protein